MTGNTSRFAAHVIIKAAADVFYSINVGLWSRSPREMFHCSLMALFCCIFFCIDCICPKCCTSTNCAELHSIRSVRGVWDALRSVRFP